MRISSWVPQKGRGAARFRLAFTRAELKKVTGFEVPTTTMRATVVRATREDPYTFKVKFSKNGSHKVSKLQGFGNKPGSYTGGWTIPAPEYGLSHCIGLTRFEVVPVFRGQNLYFTVPTHEQASAYRKLIKEGTAIRSMEDLMVHDAHAVLTGKEVADPEPVAEEVNGQQTLLQAGDDSKPVVVSSNVQELQAAARLFNEAVRKFPGEVTFEIFTDRAGRNLVRDLSVVTPITIDLD